MDFVNWALSPWGENDSRPHLVGPVLGLARGRRAVPPRPRRLHAVLAASQAGGRRGRSHGSGASRTAGEDPAALLRRADVPLGDGVLDAGAGVHGVPADHRHQVRVGLLALDGRHPADRLDHLPHHPRHVLPGLLVDLGRPEGHPGGQGRDDAGVRHRSRRARSRASTRSAIACITWPCWWRAWARSRRAC